MPAVSTGHDGHAQIHCFMAAFGSSRVNSIPGRCVTRGVFDNEGRHLAGCGEHRSWRLGKGPVKSQSSLSVGTKCRLSPLGNDGFWFFCDAQPNGVLRVFSRSGCIYASLGAQNAAADQTLDVDFCDWVSCRLRRISRYIFPFEIRAVEPI